MTFIFDLDGTVTAAETLPMIAAHFAVTEDIAELTAQTVAGGIPFEDSLLQRVAILGRFDISEVNAVLRAAPVLPGLMGFIKARRSGCVIATGNLDVWIAGLSQRIGCKVHSSRARVEDNAVVGVDHILNKDAVVQAYQGAGDRVVYIGDGHNDLGAMQQADIAIASSIVHAAPSSVRDVCDFTVWTEVDLLALLERIETGDIRPKQRTIRL